AEPIRTHPADANGPVMVILDSDHSETHVTAELEAYSPLVSPGSVLHVQDGVIDQVMIFRYDRPGPLPAIKKFLARHPEFVWERERSERFLITHHPMGWLRRIRDSSTPAGSTLVSGRATPLR